MNTTDKNLNKLQMVQNCTCRIILRADKDVSVVQMHHKLELPMLKQRRVYHQAMDCFNNITNEEAGLHHMYNESRCERRTRSSDSKLMEVPNIRSCVGRKAHSYKGPSFWNGLRIETRCIKEKEKFKRHINKITCRDVNHPG